MPTTDAPAEPQLGDPLPRTMDTIRESCGRFRVLVLGKEGVGKSSLINSIFKVDSLAEVSEYTVGKADIEKEMFLPENDFFVLHDSRGYGSGEVDNFAILTEFINNRTGNANVRDQLHAIWLCIATPIAGARVLEAGDEKIFQDFQGKVPIVVVFTRYDDLVMTKEHQLQDSGRPRTEDEIQSLAKLNAYQSFKKDCIAPITKVNDNIPSVCVSVKPKFEETLQNLVNTTLHHINFGKYPLPHVLSTNPSKLRSTFRNFFSFKPSEKAEPINTDAANSVGIMLATAQRVVLDPKITESINVGQKKYWRGLASGANFFGKDLRRCLEVIHDDIVLVWNFRNLPILYDDSFRGKLSTIADLADLQGSSPNEHMAQNTAIIAGTVGVVAAISAVSANPVGFIVGPIIIGAVFARWVYDIYKATPGVLQCFMAYIVDLTIIMQMIFVISQARADGVVKPEEVCIVLRYFEADQRSGIHRDIKQFVREMGVLKAVVDKDIVLDKMVQLIDHYRVRGEDSTPLERNIAR